MQIVREHDARPNGDSIVLKLRGRICPSSSDEAVDIGSLYGVDVFGRTVVLDLREADYIGSSGVNWLLSQRKAFLEAGGRLAICCSEGSVLDVLRLMRIDRIVPVSDNLDAPFPGDAPV